MMLKILSVTIVELRNIDFLGRGQPIAVFVVNEEAPQPAV